MHLRRLRHPDEAEFTWLSHSLVSLAESRSDIYRQSEFESGAPAPTEFAAIHVALSVGRIPKAIWALSQPDVRRWVEAGVPIIMDDSGEAGLRGAAQWAELRSGVERLGLSRCNIIWLLQNETGPKLCAEAFAGHPTIRAQAVVLHYWMHYLRSNVRRHERPKRGDRKVRFLSLNYKLRPHRAVVLGHLVNSNLIDRGLVSLAKQTPGTHAFEWPTFEAFEGIAQEIFPAYAADIAAVRPMLGANHILAGELGADPPLLATAHAQSGFSLVNETEMSAGEVVRFTEKALKPLATWHPMVVAGNPGTLALLRRIGFKTFAPVVDESYDDIVDPQERLTRVLAEARRLITMPEVDFDQMLDRMERILEHNVEHFFNGLPSIMEEQHEALLSAAKQMALVA